MLVIGSCDLQKTVARITYNVLVETLNPAPSIRTPPTFCPGRVRILVDPGSIFTKYKCIIKLASTVSDQL